MRWIYKYPWVPPLAFALLVLLTGLVTYRVIDHQLRSDIAEDLTTIRDTTTAALTEWMMAQERTVETAADEAGVRSAALELAHLQRSGASSRQLQLSSATTEIAQQLSTYLTHGEFEAYGLVVDDIIVASSRGFVGKRAVYPHPEHRQRLLNGETVLTSPTLSRALTDGHEETVMWVGTPVRELESKTQIGFLVFRIDPAKSFARLLRLSRFGDTGETYAFNREAMMVSKSRMEDQLRSLGLIQKMESTILRIHVRDPGADLTRGGRPAGPLEQQPLTRMADSALKGERNVDVKGYRDFRGVIVVGAWMWLPQYQLGIATEIDRREAYRTLNVVRNAVSLLVGVLLLAAAAIAVGSRVLANQRATLRKAEKLGQYTLEEHIGQGGMGTVYRARHSFLRRPTALKVLRSADITDADRQRFEREVQATSQLTHPNTIAIYDYGRTASGVFYYAMEYLEGITLAGLVASDGAQPQARVLFIMRQMCGALAEAHRAGLVHRDVKPQNVMLCARAGLYDLVKVLDFGLVKSVTQDVSLTAADVITGTPHYMAPEAIQSPSTVDARSDVYATAAVGFYLLTAREVFVASSLMGVLTRTMTEDPPRPSTITIDAIHPGLEALLLECLDRDPSKRPNDASVLLDRLNALGDASELAWSQESAQAWWRAHENLTERPQQAPLSTAPTLAIDVEERISGGVDSITGREPTLLMEREE